MPMYDVLCSLCEKRDVVVRTVEQRDMNLPVCCDSPMHRIISAPAVQAGFEPYESPKSGKWIASRTQQREDLKRTGSFLYEPGVREQIARTKQEKWNETLADVDKKVDNVVRDLHTSGRI